MSITLTDPTTPTNITILVDSSDFAQDPFTDKESFSFTYSNPGFNVSQITQSVTETGTDHLTDSHGTYQVFFTAVASSGTYNLGDPQTTGDETFTVQVPKQFFLLVQGELIITYDIKLTNTTTGGTLDYIVKVDITGGSLPPPTNSPPLANPYTQDIFFDPKDSFLIISVGNVSTDPDGDTVIFQTAAVRDQFIVSSTFLLAGTFTTNPFSLEPFEAFGGASFLAAIMGPPQVSNEIALLVSKDFGSRLLAADTVTFGIDYTVSDGHGNSAGNVITVNVTGGTTELGSTDPAAMKLSSTVDAIEAIYIGYFGRAGDVTGVKYWDVARLVNGMTFQQMAASFSVQPETLNQYAFLANPQNATHAQIDSFIASVYQDLFNRAPDAAGLAYWENFLTTNIGDPQAVGAFILTVILGALGQDQTTISNKINVADFLLAEFSAANIAFDAAAAALSHSAIAGTTSDPATVATQDHSIAAFVNTQLNITAGTAGNDVLTGAATGSNVWGNGGADTINLAAAGAQDNIFLADLGFGSHAAPSSITDPTDTAQPGFWGIAAGGVATAISTPGAGGLFAAKGSGGTSGDMSVVHNFQMLNGNPTADVINFSVAAWGAGGANAAGGAAHGLVTAGGATITAGSNAIVQFVVPGATLNANESLVVLNQGSFADAAAVATALTGGSYNLILAKAIAQNDNEHILLAYNDTTGSLRIADVDLTNYTVAAGTTKIQQMTVDVSDMAQLVGVSSTSLAANTSNVHFIA